MSGVDAWLLPAGCHIDQGCLTAAERGHAAGHRSPAAAARHRRGRALLRHGLAPRLECRPGAVALRRPPCGAPEVLGRPDLGASVAHSVGVVVAAVRERGRVGIDVEVTGGRDRPVPHVVLRPDRLAAVAPLVGRDLAPLAVWVVLEAALKAAGTGFAQPQGAVAITAAAGGVHLDLPVGGVHGCRLHRLPGGVLAAVATPRVVPAVRWHVPGPVRPGGVNERDAHPWTAASWASSAAA